LKAVLAGLLVISVVLGSAAVYQQEQISSLNHLLDAATVEIGGVRYWDMPFPAFAPNGTSVKFHGLNFTSVSPPPYQNSYSDPSKYIYFGSVRLSNGTLLNLTGKSVEISTSGRFPFFSSVAVSFPGGVGEVYNGYSVAAVNMPADYNLPYEHVLLNVTYHAPAANPWFTQHAHPQAGVLWNSTGDQLTFYVSIG